MLLNASKRLFKFFYKIGQTSCATSPFLSGRPVASTVSAFMLAASLLASDAVSARTAAFKEWPQTNDFPSVELQTSQKKIGTIDFSKNRLTVVNLWATWCAPCVAELPSLMRLGLQLRRDGIAVVLINQDKGGVSIGQSFLKQMKIDTPDAFGDPRNIVSKHFGARGLPYTLLVDRSGRVLAAVEGAMEWDAPEVIRAVKRFAQK
jgi:thiol-disulfide isomerase/thioredoxin